jgi:hypothetical protein
LIYFNAAMSNRTFADFFRIYFPFRMKSLFYSICEIKRVTLQTVRLQFLGFLLDSLRWRNLIMNNDFVDRLLSDSTAEGEKVRLLVIGAPEGVMDVM